MRLVELRPSFIRYETRIDSWEVVDGDPATWRERGCPCKQVTGPKNYSIEVSTLAEAQGIRFLCPKCFAANKGEIGTHGCEVTFDGRGAAPEHGSHNEKGVPTRWQVSGDSFDNLTTMPSILLIGGCGWHGYITNGDAS